MPARAPSTCTSRSTASMLRCAAVGEVRSRISSARSAFSSGTTRPSPGEPSAAPPTRSRRSTRRSRPRKRCAFRKRLSSPTDVAKRKDWLTLGAAAIAFRFFSAGLAFLAHVVFPNYQPEPFAGMWGVPSPFWDTFTRYDAGWYYQIARNGYEFVTGGPSVGVGKPGKIAYFPLYPYLMRYTGRLFGRRAGDAFLGGIAVSWTAFILGMIVLFYLARLDLTRRQAGRAVLLSAIFPFAFFYGVVYSESTFLLCVVTTFYCF